MALGLSHADFKLVRVVCEVRYANAYLIFDRTGQIFHDLRNSFVTMQVATANPTQTVFQSEEGEFVLDVSQSRFTSQKADSKLEAFARQCKRYFEVVMDALEIKTFTRIGLRGLFRKEFGNREEARAALNTIKILSLKPGPRFGASEQLDEIILRWEGKQIGTLFRLKADTTTIDVTLPVEIGQSNSEIHKSIHGLVLDIDYYTAATVQRDQWDPNVWITQAIRTMGKGADDILTG